MLQVRRYDDVEKVTRVTRTPSGGRRLEGVLRRVGVFAYKYADGSVVREYAPPEEVLRAESVISYEGAPVTDLHPPELVTPDTYKDVVRGHVHDPRAEVDHIVAAVDVDDAGLIAKVDAGEACEISTGYTADFDPTPGVTPNGERYDGIQRRIRGNHVALGPPGWGRQGPSVSLRMDSSTAIASCISVAEATSTRHDSKEPIMNKVRIDGIEYEVGSASHISALERQAELAKKRADDAEASVAVEKKRADDAETAVKAAHAETAKEKTRADAAEKVAEPKALAKRIDSRVGLITLARKHLGSRYLADAAGEEPGTQAAGKSDDDIIKAVVAKLSPGVDTKTMTHEMLMGALVALTCNAGAETEAAEMAEPDVEGFDGETGGNEEPKPGPSGFDSRTAPRGKIGARNDALDALTDGAGGATKIKTQAEALAERARNDATAWQRPIPR